MTETKWDVAERVLKNAIANYGGHNEWASLPLAMCGYRGSISDAHSEHGSLINAVRDTVKANRPQFNDDDFYGMTKRQRAAVCRLALRIIQRKRRGER